MTNGLAGASALGARATGSGLGGGGTWVLGFGLGAAATGSGAAAGGGGAGLGAAGLGAGADAGLAAEKLKPGAAGFGAAFAGCTHAGSVGGDASGQERAEAPAVDMDNYCTCEQKVGSSVRDGRKPPGQTPGAVPAWAQPASACRWMP